MFNLKLFIMKNLTYLFSLIFAIALMSTSCTKPTDDINYVKVTITVSANTVDPCTSVTFTATPTFGGTTPLYQWKVNGVNVGTNSSTYAYFPTDNDAVTCILTSNDLGAIGSPATSNTVTIKLNPATQNTLIGHWNFVSLTGTDNIVRTDSLYLLQHYGVSGKIRITAKNDPSYGYEIFFDYLNHTEAGTEYFNYTVASNVLTIPNMGKTYNVAFEGNTLVLTGNITNIITSSSETVKYRLKK
jgi:hypothetical protein